MVFEQQYKFYTEVHADCAPINLLYSRQLEFIADTYKDLV